jgi:hypothetical protein
MKVGAEDRSKVALLAGLAVVAAGTVYLQFFSEDATTGGGRAVEQRAARSIPRSTAPTARSARRIPQQRTASRSGRQGRGQTFDPVWRRFSDEETFSPLEADPTLRTDLLAAVRQVEFGGVERNIFEFTTPKKVVEPPPKEQVEEAQKRQEEFEQRATKEEPPTEEPAAPAVKHAPKLSWKYYGFANRAGSSQRRAFLLDGDEVLIGGAGDVFRDRYEVVRIGLDSIVIEDKEFSEQQTLAITVRK